jgi:hypothetical protein
MSDKPRIIVGIVIALIILTAPFWYALYSQAAGTREPPPEVALPEGQSQCVEDAAYMRAHHMDLLDEWRDAVVRDGDAEPVVVDGKEYPKSLTKGCMACHTSRQDFCNACHDYAAVVPNCWECHVEPEHLEPEAVEAEEG